MNDRPKTPTGVYRAIHEWCVASIYYQRARTPNVPLDLIADIVIDRAKREYSDVANRLYVAEIGRNARDFVEMLDGLDQS